MPLPFLQRRRKVDFEDAAGAAVRAAQAEALALRHDQVGPEHFLLGVLAVADDTAARVLDASFGVRLGPTRERVARLRAQSAKPRRAPLPFDPSTRKVIDHAARLSEERGTPVTPGDLVLGVLAAGGAAAELLTSHGAAAPALRRALDAAAAGTAEGALAAAEAPPPVAERQERPWARRLLEAAPPGWELTGLEQGDDEVRAVFRRRDA